MLFMSRHPAKVYTYNFHTNRSWPREVPEVNIDQFATNDKLILGIINLGFEIILDPRCQFRQ